MFENNSRKDGSWGVKTRFLGGLVVFPLVGLLGLTGCSALPRATPKADRAVLIQGYREVASRVRGLPLTREVKVEQEAPAAMAASFGAELDKPENHVFLSNTELLLRQFRMLHPDVPLRALYLKLMSQQVAAYYDPEKKRLVYVDENVAATKNKDGAGVQGLQQFVYVHEFCHALEDDHFNLDRLTKASMGDLDQNLALTCFAEGNAVLAGVDGLLDEYGVPLNTATPFNAWLVDQLGGVNLEDAAEEMDGVPPFLTGALVRPYLDGAVFSNRIRRDLGWRGIDDVYRTRIPRTTAEVLYPERRYLKGFRPAVFEPAPQLFSSAAQGVVTNSMGVLGTALWLGGTEMTTASDFGFLKGWMGDQVYFIKGQGAAVQTVWVSLWERSGMARSFRRQIERRLKERFGDVTWAVRREGCLVVAVWDSTGAMNRVACDALAASALRTRVEVDKPSALASLSQDVPWPVCFPDFGSYGAGCEVLGGYVADIKGGPGFFRMSLASGLLLRTESNPDRHYYGTLWGLVRHVGDERSDFTYWKLPVLASWHRRGEGNDQRYCWRLVWGVLASGDEHCTRVLFVPVWHSKQPGP